MSLTWSPAIAMTKKEIDTFLNKKLVARAATIREDGYPHVTPLWYYWDGENVYFILGAGARPRHHIANLRRDPRMSMIIDRDPRAERGPPDVTDAQGVVIRGRAELLTDEETQVEIVGKLLRRYRFARYLDAVLQDGKPGKNRVIAKILPEKIIAWDMRKLRKGYKAKK